MIRPLLAALFALAAIPAAAGPYDLPQAGQAVTAVPTKAVELGRIAGAATACKTVDRKRIKDDIVAFNFVLLAGSKTKDDFKTASLQFDTAIGEGQNAVQSARENCEAALTTLASAEQSLNIKTVAKTTAKPTKPVPPPPRPAPPHN